MVDSVLEKRIIFDYSKYKTVQLLVQEIKQLFYKFQVDGLLLKGFDKLPKQVQKLIDLQLLQFKQFIITDSKNCKKIQNIQQFNNCLDDYIALRFSSKNIMISFNYSKTFENYSSYLNELQQFALQTKFVDFKQVIDSHKPIISIENKMEQFVSQMMTKKHKLQRNGNLSIF